MKFLLRFYLLLLFTVSFSFATCLGNPLGSILDLGGSKGVDSARVIGNNVYISLNFEDHSNRLDDNGDPISLSGFAKVDASDLSKFKVYNWAEDYKDDSSLNSSQYQTAYIRDLEAFTTFYLYGKDFIFGNETLDTNSLFFIQKAVNENGTDILYGYVEDYNSDVFYTFKAELSSTLIVSYEKFSNVRLGGVKSDENSMYVMLLPVNSNGDYLNTYKLIKSDFGTTFTASEEIFQSLEFASEQTWISSSLALNDDKIFVQFNNHIFKHTKVGVQEEDIGSLFNELGVLLDATCSHIFYSKNFDSFAIKNFETNETNSLPTWDPFVSTRNENIMYVANMGAMVNAIDISDPKNLVIDANTTEWGHTDDVFVMDDRLYVSRGWAGLSIYDISGCTSDISEDPYICSPSDTNTTPSTDLNDTNTTLNPCSQCCFDENDLNALPSGWTLAGSGCSLDTSIFDSVSIVWAWNNVTQSWKAYSFDSTTSTNISNATDVETLQNIDAKQGFWILK